MSRTTAEPVETDTMQLSQKIYEWLLALYPKAYRDAYRQPMAQLFRDQSRAAWREAGWMGVVSLWLHVLPDLVRTSLVEHLAAMKRKRTMTDKISNVIGRGGTPWRIILRVAAPVFLLVFGLSVILTFLMPESFASTARIKLDRGALLSSDQNSPRGTFDSYDPFFIQTEFEVLQSELVLGKVVDSLDLNALWGKKYGGGTKLKSADTIRILKDRMTLRPVRNTGLIEIRVHSEDRNEAAHIANAIAESYREYRYEERLHLIQGGISVLEQRYEEQLSRIATAQKEVENLRQKLQISNIDAEGMAPLPSMEAETIRRYQTELIAAQAQLTQLEVSVVQLKRLPPEELIQVLPRTRQDQLLTELLSQVNLAEQDLARAKRDFAPDHPQFVRAKEQLEELRNKVNESVTGVMTSLENQLASQKAGVDKLQELVNGAKKLDIQKAEDSRPYYNKKRELESLRMFERILGTKLASERIDLTIPHTSRVEIVDKARPGVKPVRPNKPLNIALGAIGGMMVALLIGGIAALIVSQTRKRIPRPTASS